MPVLAVSRATAVLAPFFISLGTLPNRVPRGDVDAWAGAAAAVRREMATVLREEPELRGGVLRLAFHDAATRQKVYRKGDPAYGANGSIRYEIATRGENRGLAGPLAAVEKVWEGVPELSLADVIALSGAEAIAAAGGPPVRIRLGRDDAAGPDPDRLRRPLRGSYSRNTVRKTLPEPGLDADGLRKYFRNLGLTDAEWIALCGAHDLGRHVTLTGMSRPCLKNLTRECLENAPVRVPFIAKDPDTLSSEYFRSLLLWNDREIERGAASFIPTDVALVVDPGLRRYVKAFAKNEDAFFASFSRAYSKLVNASAGTGRAIY